MRATHGTCCHGEVQLLTELRSQHAYLYSQARFGQPITTLVLISTLVWFKSFSGLHSMHWVFVLQLHMFIAFIESLGLVLISNSIIIFENIVNPLSIFLSFCYFVSITKLDDDMNLIGSSFVLAFTFLFLFVLFILIVFVLFILSKLCESILINLLCVLVVSSFFVVIFLFPFFLYIPDSLVAVIDCNG